MGDSYLMMKECYTCIHYNSDSGIDYCINCGGKNWSEEDSNKKRSKRKKEGVRCLVQNLAKRILTTKKGDSYE